MTFYHGYTSGLKLFVLNAKNKAAGSSALSIKKNAGTTCK
jgi:hypothetical protein